MTREETIKQMVLGWPLELKLKTLKELKDDGNTDMFLPILMILLETPIDEGGVNVDVITEHLEAS
jgi:hypothetical protein